MCGEEWWGRAWTNHLNDGMILKIAWTDNRCSIILKLTSSNRVESLLLKWSIKDNYHSASHEVAIVTIRLIDLQLPIVSLWLFVVWWLHHWCWCWNVLQSVSNLGLHSLQKLCRLMLDLVFAFCCCEDKFALAEDGLHRCSCSSKLVHLCSGSKIPLREDQPPECFPLLIGWLKIGDHWCL